MTAYDNVFFLLLHDLGYSLNIHSKLSSTAVLKCLGSACEIILNSVCTIYWFHEVCSVIYIFYIMVL